MRGGCLARRFIAGVRSNLNHPSTGFKPGGGWEEAASLDPGNELPSYAWGLKPRPCGCVPNPGIEMPGYAWG